MLTLPRLVLAAPSTGQGKTTVATGLMAALTERGHRVSGHKVGPDFIDPGYHALATARPGRNLDPHLVGEDLVVPLLLHGAAGADIAVIEGVMGLHDGRIGTDGFASTAHVARLTRSPVVLVLDVSRISRSAGAIVAGMADWDPEVDVVGVILNKCGSARNLAEVERSIRLPVLGRLPADQELAAPSRHLGLVPAAERDASVSQVARLGEQVAAHIDLDGVLDVAGAAPDLPGPAWDPNVVRSHQASVEQNGPEQNGPEQRDPEQRDPEQRDPEQRDPEPAGPVIAVAGGRAFTFRYAETDELLSAAGCRVVGFDPLVDPVLPEGTRGIYLGGGFPEMYAAELAANTPLLAEVRAAVAAGVPTVAECAGMLYLAASLDEVPMAGVLPATAEMTPRRTLRYPVATAVADSLLTRAGETVTGHEFHRTETTPEHAGGPAWLIEGQPVGFASADLHASYLHVHWAGHPQFAARFADAARAAQPHHQQFAQQFAQQPAHQFAQPPHPASGEPEAPVADPLLHHGDTEIGPGLVDFAVNVYDGPRPDWLESALRESLDRAAGYPDVSVATQALAAHLGRPEAEVLPTAGAAEAFELIARLTPWRHPVVVHPQFTEPHAALIRAGCRVDPVLLTGPDFALDPAVVPEDADLVILGNPTNPTGVLHPRAAITALLRPGRLVVVDEAFMDAVPDEPESLLSDASPGLVVLRSLTKHWSIPGIRAGYLAGTAEVVAGLRQSQVPWAVSAPAIAALVACSGPQAVTESRRRANEIEHWRLRLAQALRQRGIDIAPSRAPFLLARLGPGVRELVRSNGVAVRRADTFPGLDDSWVRIAVRAPRTTQLLLDVLDQLDRPWRTE